MSTTFTASLLSLSKTTVLLYSIFSTNAHAKIPFILCQYATAHTVWNNTRLFSPSLPGDRYLKLSVPKRSPGRNLGEHYQVQRFGTTSSSTVLLVFQFAHVGFPHKLILPYAWENTSAQGQLNTFDVFKPGFNIQITLSVCS